jgi:hypothetical protein
MATSVAPPVDALDNITDPNEAYEKAGKVLDLAVKQEAPLSSVEQSFGIYENDDKLISAASQKLYESRNGQTYPMISRRVPKEIAKGVVRFGESVGGFVGGTTFDWLGQFIEHGGYAIDQISQWGNKNRAQVHNPYAQTIIATGQNISAWGKDARQKWAEEAATGWEALDEGLAKVDPVAYASGRLTEGVASSALAVLSMYLSGGVATTGLISKSIQVNRGLFALSLMSAGSGFEHAQAQKENFLWSTLHGFLDGIIEYAMETSFLDELKGGGELLGAGRKEATEEFFTGMMQDIRAFMLEGEQKGLPAYDAAKIATSKALKNAPWNVSAGFIGGEMVHGGTSLIDLYGRTFKAPKDGELTPEELASMAKLKTDYERIVSEGGPAQMQKLRDRLALEMVPPITEAIDTSGLPATKVPVKKKPKKIKPAEQKALWSETTPIEDTTSDAAKAEAVFNKADIELQRIKDSQKGVGKLWRKVKRAVWDTSASIKKGLLKEGGKYGKEAVVRHDLIKGASSKAARIINDSTKEIYKGLNKDEIKTLDRIIQSRRIIAIDKYKPAPAGSDPLFATMKHPGGLTATEHTEYIKNLPEKTRKKLNAKADEYFKAMKGQLDALKKAGLISEGLHKALSDSGDYEPRRFIQYIDPESTYTFGGKTISVPDSGLKKLDTGSYEVLENNSQLLLAEVVKRTQVRIARNNANQALWQMVKDVPNNGIVTEAEVENVSNLTSRAKYTYKPAKGGQTKISVVVDGVTRQMLMPTELAQEWVVSDPVINAQVANIVGWVSGSKILKPMATGINPEFALTNFPRDIAHVLLTTEEYSPHAPIAIAQMIQDFSKVKADTFARKGRWLDYIDEGGGMEFLTHQGGVTSKTTGALKDLQTALGYLGETSEIWTRLALRERALRNGKSNIEATWIARNYLDFSQGGNVAKAIDTAVPYFNASIQGTRGVFRAAARNPKVFAYKAAQLGTFAIGLMLANRYKNKEAWENVSDHDKANYFIITTPFSYKDKDGEKRYLYFRVAKDQGQKLICSVFENLMGKYLGDDINVDQVTDAAKGLAVMTPSEMLPPTFDAMLGYAMNKNFWRQEDIWKGPEVIDKEEYTNYTHPAWVKMGEVTGLSPEKTKYALQQYFTSGNIYTSMVDWGLGAVMDKMPESEQEKITEDILRQQPFIRRVLKATDPFNEHARVVERIKLEEQTRIYKQNRDLDALLDKLYAGKATEDDVDKFIYTKDISDVGRLEERRVRSMEFKGIPDRRWWLQVSYATPEAAATMYWTRYNTANKEERAGLDSTLDILPGIKTKRFVSRIEELQAKK